MQGLHVGGRFVRRFDLAREELFHVTGGARGIDGQAELANLPACRQTVRSFELQLLVDTEIHYRPYVQFANLWQVGVGQTAECIRRTRPPLPATVGLPANFSRRAWRRSGGRSSGREREELVRPQLGGVDDEGDEASHHGYRLAFRRAKGTELRHRGQPAPLRRSPRGTVAWWTTTRRSSSQRRISSVVEPGSRRARSSRVWRSRRERRWTRCRRALVWALACISHQGP